MTATMDPDAYLDEAIGVALRRRGIDPDTLPESASLTLHALADAMAALAPPVGEAGTLAVLAAGLDAYAAWADHAVATDPPPPPVHAPGAVGRWRATCPWCGGESTEVPYGITPGPVSHRGNCGRA